MPRTKQSRRSDAAKKRIFDRVTAVPEEALPPLKKLAELTPRCVHHNVHKVRPQKRYEKPCQKCCQKPCQKPCQKCCSNSEPKPVPEPEPVQQPEPKSVQTPEPTPVHRPVRKPVQTSEPKSQKHSKMTMNAVLDVCPQKPYITGSFHQGDARFVNYGKQCGVNSLTAILMCKMKNMLQWSTSDINSVLTHGDQFYSDMNRAGKISDDINGYVYVEELPKTHTLNDCLFSINYGTTISGVFGVHKYDKSLRDVYMSLDKAVTRAFQSFDACLVNIQHNICAAVRQGSWYAVFDPHSRNSDGTLACEGKSVVVFHRDIRSLCTHFNKLGASLEADGTLFEVTGVNVNLSDMPSVSVYSPVVETNAEAEQEVQTEMEVDVRCDQCLIDVTSTEKVSVNETFAEKTPVVPCLESTNENTDDVEFISQTVNDSFQFGPLTVQQQRSICLKLNIVNIERVQNNANEILEMAEPCETQSIEADGNCFFRSVSYAVSGSEQEHRKVRRAVVTQILQNQSKYIQCLREGNSSVSDYISTSRMKYLGVWATELEIQATSDLIGVDIFTYSQDKWLKYSSSNVLSNRHGCQYSGIYLKHVNNCHYEVVVCVKEKDGNCACICKSSWEGSEFNASLKPKSHQRKLNRQKVHYSTNDDLKQRIKDNVNKRYHEDETYKDKLIKSSTKKYKQNQEHQEQVKKYSIDKYKSNEEHRDSLKQYSLQMYTTNPEHRDIVKKKSSNKYSQNELHRDAVKKLSVDKYSQNELHRDAVKKLSVDKYSQNELHRDAVKKLSVDKYSQNELHRDAVKKLSVDKYSQNELHRDAVKKLSVDKYSQNELHRDAVKKLSVDKYSQNELHRDAVKKFSVDKYSHNELHRDAVKKLSVDKYSQNELHRDAVKKLSVDKYSQNEIHKNMVIDYNIQKYKNANIKRKEIDCVIEQFKEKISTGPEYVCSVCHRCCFKMQVKHCKINTYLKKSAHAGNIAEKCVTLNYLHKCCEDCTEDCVYKNSPAASLWICHTCDRKISDGKMPAESVANNLALDPIPAELSCLNSLEQHLIAKHIPFMKMLALPRGGQNGVHGPVTCVPSNVTDVVNVLPRSENDDLMIRVKLKRKLTYKGHYEYKYVHTENIKAALAYLKEHNKWYLDVDFNESWINPLNKTEEEMIDKTDHNQHDLDVCVDKENNSENHDTEITEDDTLHDRQQHGLFMDSCLQPVDIAQEFLDQQFESIMAVAPAEGNNPVRMLMDETNEAKCFPVLFPKGTGTFHDSRPEKLTLSRYLNNKILNADGRFAQNLDYIFYGQYLSELNQVISNVSIALRKGYNTGNKRQITSETLTNKESLQNILNFDQGYKFLKPIRGSPVFWQAVQKDLFAMVRQLGIPTWFCSFSSADLRWTELMQTIVTQERCDKPLDELDWSERCGMLKRNPVTAARMFDHRFHCFLKDVIMSPAQPIGKVIDYFYRIEFQQRGSPHTHCLFWVENAPQVDRDDDKDVVAFVDQYVTCEMPSEQEETHEIVSSVQQHSKRHAKTCKKKGTTCRFNFPRPPSKNTFITRSSKTDKDTKGSDEQENQVQKSNDCNQIPQDFAEAVMKQVKECLLNPDAVFDSVDSLFASIGINQQIFEAAYSKMTKKTNVVLKRKASDVWVNQYNPDLLRCWNANMDIQFVIDAYSCIVYIVSYISKAEREMGLLLANAQKEAHNQGNMDAKQALRKLGSVFLHNREVSAQESVYRLTNMRLKESSRKVVFIPTGPNTVKMSLPLNIIQKKAECAENDDDEIWMKSITDRYRARPKTEEFNEMCLASFASQYRVLSKSEMSCSNRVTLEDDMGFVRKRTRTDCAVVRYARFSPTKNPENYFQSILELFLPHFMQSQLKPVNFTSHQDFYETGYVTMCETLDSVKSIVDTNMAKFEKEADTIQRAQDALEKHGPMEDAWAQICPEAELERLECLENKQQIEAEEGDDVIPDLLPNAGVSRIENNPSAMTKQDAMALLRSLNEKQSQIFYKVREWCLAKVQGENPDPFHLFISGPGGVGKSVLIKAIQYESSRILSKLSENPDETHVLLTAPTGVAAYNINAATIHSTFSIGTNASLPYVPLGDEKINSLRAKLGKLQLLIIDEISMVDHKLLAYIHGRLRQIKQTGLSDYSAFGKVCVIAVGDFYQLSPVKGKPLYTEPMNSVNLWDTNFSYVELTEIMRQKDKHFAELLNRLRVHKKGEPMLEQDVTVLKQCETGEGDDCTDIHIYATNSEVDEHNIKMLCKLCSDTVTINAQDFERNAKTGRMERKDGFHSRVHNSSLEKSLELAVDARVMLQKNINVSDGLVNGVFGTVKEFCYNDDETFPSKIYIEFDDERVGKEARSKIPCLKPGLEKSTAIEPEEDKVSSMGVRRQYPLRLAWASTVHKVQGLTVKKAVVSLKKIFAPGQAYVALSRVTSLDGLIIEDFKEKVIYSKDDIEQSLQSMPPFIVPCETTESVKFQMMLHNVQGLIPHILDIRQDHRYFQADMICVTETWLKPNCFENDVRLTGYHFHDKPRSVSYDTSQDVFAKLKEQDHGGVGIYYRENVKAALLDVSCFNMECLMCKIEHLNTNVAVVYRPSSYNMPLFRENLVKLIIQMNSLPGGKIILGDFNENLLSKSTICDVMQDFGFKQVVESVTTESGTLIDHVYIKDIDLDKIKIDIMPTYFSYHDCIVLKWLF